MCWNAPSFHFHQAFHNLFQILAEDSCSENPTRCTSRRPVFLLGFNSGSTSNLSVPGWWFCLMRFFKGLHILYHQLDGDIKPRIYFLSFSCHGAPKDTVNHDVSFQAPHGLGCQAPIALEQISDLERREQRTMREWSSSYSVTHCHHNTPHTIPLPRSHASASTEARQLGSMSPVHISSCHVQTSSLLQMPSLFLLMRFYLFQMAVGRWASEQRAHAV